MVTSALPLGYSYIKGRSLEPGQHLPVDLMSSPTSSGSALLDTRIPCMDTWVTQMRVREEWMIGKEINRRNNILDGQPCQQMLHPERTTTTSRRHTHLPELTSIEAEGGKRGPSFRTSSCLGQECLKLRDCLVPLFHPAMTHSWICAWKRSLCPSEHYGAC